MMTIVHTGLLLVSVITIVDAWTSVEYAQGAGAGKISQQNVVIGTIFLLLLIYTVKQKIGYGMPLIIVLFLLYAAFGDLLPPPYGHRGYSIRRIVGNLILEPTRSGQHVAASSVIIATFMIFGAILQMTRGGELCRVFTIDSWQRARGACEVAVLGSGLMGSINGSVSANVVGTGVSPNP
jgi:TRAP-type uncharacterized transport system fused permease subunit